MNLLLTGITVNSRANVPTQARECLLILRCDIRGREGASWVTNADHEENLHQLLSFGKANNSEIDILDTRYQHLALSSKWVKSIGWQES
jgi:hypothetical protein